MDGAVLFFWFFLSLVLLLGPHLMALDPRLAFALNAAGGLLFIVGAQVWAVYRLWRKNTADVAFFRTGFGRPLVAIDRGAFVVPTLHEVQNVTLRSIAMELQRSGAGGVRCKDKLRANLTITVFARVAKSEEGVRLAATLFGEDADDGERIRAHVEPHVADVVEKVAAALTVAEIQENRERFTMEIHEMVSAAVEPFGLRVDTVTLTGFDQGDPKHLNPANTLDAKALEMLWDDARSAAKAKEGLLGSQNQGK